MVPITNNIVNESFGVQTSVAFSAKAENLGVLFHILRNQLYSDPITAILREYSTNGFDAHVMAGKPTLPIQVSLPNYLDCFLKIRDFGPGLSDEEVQDIYASYGESTKRKNQDATGMLGIGCKSGFAYNDSFIVNSYKDGVLVAWNAYLDESNCGKMAKMAEDKTTEPNGIEIIIPVKSHDIDKFKSKAFHLFSFFSVPPTIHNIDQTEEINFKNSCDRKSLYKGKNWALIGSGTQSYATMGNITYPIDYRVFGNDLSADLIELVKSGIILNFKIGDLEFAASREALQYSPFTKKAIIKALQDVKKEVVDTVAKDFQNCKTLWDAKCLFREVFDMTGKLYHIRYLVQSCVTFGGNKIQEARFSTSTRAFGDIITSHYSKDRRYSGDRATRKEAASFVASPRTFVIFNDKKIINGILNRVAGLIEGNKYDNVYVLNFKDDAVKADWIKGSGFDGPTAELSTLPKEPLSKYYGNLMNSGSLGFTNPKYSTNEFVYQNQRLASSANKSEYWTKTDIDVTKDAGVYVAVERFEFSDQTGYFRAPKNLPKSLAILSNLSLVVPVIYGLKPASLAKAKQNKKMISLWDYLKDAANNYFKNNPALEQGYFDNLSFHANSPIQKSVVDYVVRNQSKLFTNKQGPLSEFFIKIKNILNTPVNVNIEVLMAFGNYNTKVQVYDFKSETDKMKKDYRLFFRLADNLSYDNSLFKDLQEYVDLVEAKNPLIGTGLPAKTVVGGKDSPSEF